MCRLVKGVGLSIAASQAEAMLDQGGSKHGPFQPRIEVEGRAATHNTFQDSLFNAYVYSYSIPTSFQVSAHLRAPFLTPVPLQSLLPVPSICSCSPLATFGQSSVLCSWFSSVLKHRFS